MSAIAVKRHAYDAAQEAELARWPGVEWSRQLRSKHYALVLTFGGVSRFVIYPSSPGDTNRGTLNHLTDVRAELRALGAIRTAEPRTAKPRRQRNRTEVIRFDRGETATGGPNRDPWEALRGLEFPPAEPAPPSARPTIWQRIAGWLASLGARP